MFDREKFNEAISAYKRDFTTIQWPSEKYKWEAVKCFQDNWDIKAPDFAEMLERSLSKTYNLLASQSNFPRNMILTFAKAAPEEVRSMFMSLFDESKELYSRFESFKTQSAGLLEKYGGGAAQHFQNENTISIYLWLRFPDKYYIYKWSEIRTVAIKLGSNYQFKKGAYADNIRNFYPFYDELCEAVSADGELIALLNSRLEDSCYPDPAFKTLTIDFGFYVSRYYGEEDGEGDGEWFPADYSPEITTEEWLRLLHDRDVFYPSSLEIVKRILDYGGQATCTQLSVKYGETRNFYNSGSVALARRVAEATGCPVMEKDTENSRYWPILYTGKSAGKEDAGVYIWKLREELAAALEQYDLSEVRLYVNDTPSIWKISHGTDRTGISDVNKEIFDKRNVVVVHSTTKAKASSKVSQGQSFMDGIKKGDYFYLCYGSNVQLLGQFISDRPVLNPEMQDGWFEREYRLIARAKITDAYTGEQKWWTPNNNSTCIKIDESDKALFERLILQPYFGMTISELFGEEEQRRYWWLTAKPQIWSFSDLAVGEVQSYTLYNDNGNKRRVFQNFLDARTGDMVIGYESAPVKQIVAVGRVSAGQDGEKIYFEKVEGLTTPIDYQAIKDCSELEKMEFLVNPNGSFFKLTKGEFDFLMDMIREENPIQHQTEHDSYSKESFLNEVYMTEADYSKMVAVLKNKKNIILQGAPGVGKTFAAKRLAWSMMGEIDESRVEFVQFHQNYSYEDFVMGYKPDGDGFRLKYGVFYRFCQRAANRSDKDFFFIIDEINRGNLSKIFGELLMLIEKDYRGEKITLAYDERPFSVPENLYIIGMMNTADRSLAMIDYALRRRFSFFDMEPGFESEGFMRYQRELNDETMDELIERIKELNREIALDKSLGKGFCIGHSYFCGQKSCTDEWLHAVVDYDILPMLSEYWFDDSAKLQKWENILNGVFQ